ncbi:MAG: hypothetical protein K2W96_02440 [Gemmataceae bacterium]|nr:hypothetical protein [Gemmataceae bacterium]
MISVLNNTTSLTAQQNLTRTSENLSLSLERLSTGLKINRGADGPAGLVISEQQRSQISGLQTAINNTSKAVSLVQTGEGAINEINGLLTKIRALTIDSANVGYNDTGVLAANQSEIANALNTITNIASTTQFGTKKLLDGSRALSVASSNSAVATATASGSIASGVYGVTIGATTASRANAVGADVSAATFASATEVLTINGVNITYTQTAAVGTTLTAAQTAINNASAQTGVRAIVDTSGGQNKLRLYNTKWGAGNGFTASTNLAAANSALGAASVAATDGTDITGSIAGTAGTGVGNVLSFNSGAYAGLKVTFGATASGDTYTSATANSFTASAPATAVNLTVDASKSLVFQIGANAGQTAQISLDNLKATALGTGVSANIADLSQVDVTKLAGNNSLASDIINVVDAAVGQVSALRGTLGAFQANTLQSTSNSLQAALNNTIAAESVVRNTDYASEIANYTRLQVQMQAGSTVLGNANQIPQMIAQLLRG